MKTFAAIACLFVVLAFSGTAEAGVRGHRCCRQKVVVCNSCCCKTHTPVRTAIKAVGKTVRAALPPYRCGKCCK